jgi:hypothetical protein
MVARLGSPRGSPRHARVADTYLQAFVRYAWCGFFLLVPLAILSVSNVLSLVPTSDINDGYSYIIPNVLQFPDPNYLAERETASNIPSSAVPLSDELQKLTEEALRVRVAGVIRVDKANTATPPTGSMEDNTNEPIGEFSEMFELQSYNASMYPVLDPSVYKPSKVSPLQVHFLADITRSIEPQTKFLLDGLERSSYVQVVAITYYKRTIKTVQINKLKLDQPLVWVIDWGSLNRDCHVLERALEGMPKIPDYLVLIDYSGSTRQTTCPRLTEKIPKERIRLVKRNIVQNRHFDEKKKWVQPGELVANQGRLISGGPVLQAPFVVRERFVEAMQALTSDLTTEIRSTDLTFFWEVGANSHYGFLRREVSLIVKRLNKNLIGNHTIKAHVGVLGSNDDGMEDGNIQESYVKQLLSTKIVVVAQRDDWENHYQLMESLASGALVLTDSMLTLPPGLKNRTNLFVYDSPKNLKRLIRKYLDPRNVEKRLAIAKEGRKVAMTSHRAWHRVEKILFGTRLTKVENSYDSAPPKDDREAVKLISDESFIASTYASRSSE